MEVMIFGCGGIAPAHIEGYLHAGEGAHIAFLADQNTARAQALIEKYALTEAVAIPDYREGLGRVDSETGGRPAELFRFRREALSARPVSGLALPLLRD